MRYCRFPLSLRLIDHTYLPTTDALLVHKMIVWMGCGINTADGLFRTCDACVCRQNLSPSVLFHASASAFA